MIAVHGVMKKMPISSGSSRSSARELAPQELRRQLARRLDRDQVVEQVRVADLDSRTIAGQVTEIFGQGPPHSDR